MAIALACALGIGACSSHKGLEANAVAETERLAEAIRDNVADTGRAERLLAVLAKVSRTTTGFFDDVRQVREEWLRINADYNAGPGVFTSLQSRLAGYRKRRANEVIRHAMEARRIATPEDWAAMAKDLER